MQTCGKGGCHTNYRAIEQTARGEGYLSANVVGAIKDSKQQKGKRQARQMAQIEDCLVLEVW